MDLLPPVDFEVARSVGASVVRPGPALSRGEAREVVEGLRAAAAASVEPIADVTRLRTPAAGDMPVVDRRTWVRANVDMAETMLAEASGGLVAPRGPKQHLDARLNGAEAGAAMALLASRVLGQYLPFGTEPRLVLVAPNVAKVERELGLVPADFRLWVCLHEQTHRLQFAEAPWLRGYLIQQVGDLLRAEKDGRGGRWVPRTAIDLILTPAQRAVLDRVTAVMSFMEGYADVMMDRVGPDVVPTVAAIRARFDDHRNRGGWRRLVNKLLGLELKLAQYRDGAAFCREVIDRVGVDGLNTVYEDAAMLPTLREIHHPGDWVTRMRSASVAGD